MLDQKVKATIAAYEAAKIAFEKITSDTQAYLESCGWQWVAKDISEYSEDGRYQYWLVSPDMYESLDLDTLDCTDREYETPVLDSEPDSKWIENTDYILF